MHRSLCYEVRIEITPVPKGAIEESTVLEVLVDRGITFHGADIVLANHAKEYWVTGTCTLTHDEKPISAHVDLRDTFESLGYSVATKWRFISPHPWDEEFSNAD